MYYIYAYFDPRTNLPFYVGKGKDDRKFSHLKEHDLKTENRDKLKVLKELKSLNITPIIKELESNIQDESVAYTREDFYILSYGRKGIEPYGILTNKIIGGKTPPTPVWTEEKKKAHSNFNKTYWTAERRKAHGLKTKGNNGGKVSLGTVSVTDLQGNSKRIPKELFDSIDRLRDITEWEYVSVTSKESKRRKESP